MCKKNSRIELRRSYIKTRIDSRNSTIDSEVRRISRDLFISERTVYRDLHEINSKKREEQTDTLAN